MAIQYRPSKHWKRWPALSNAHSINSSTTAKSRPYCQTKSSDDIAWGTSGKEARFLNKLRRLLGKADEEDRKLILYMAQKMANR